MKICRYLFTFLFVGFLFFVNANAQAVEISNEIYMENYISALQKTRSTSRRRQSSSEHRYAGQVPWKETDTEEFDEQTNSRSTRIATSGKKKTTYENISVAGVSFCRVNKKLWSASDRDCLQGANLAGEVYGTITEAYAKENVLLNSEKVTLYRATVKHEKVDERTGKKRLVYLSDNKLWISSNNLILRREYIAGKNATNFAGKVVETYEYNPKIVKIEAPIR